MKHGKRARTGDARIIVAGEQRIGYFAVFAVAAEVSGQRNATAENVRAARRDKFSCKGVRFNGEITKSDKK